MARHKRLGVDSAAYGISRDVCSVIAKFVPGLKVVVAGGHSWIDNKDEADPAMRYFEAKPLTRVVEYDMRGSEREMEPLPEYRNGSSLFRYKDELWIVGGSTHNYEAAESAFVLKKNGQWRTVHSVTVPPRNNSVTILYKNSFLTFGGYVRSSSTPAPDHVFTIEGKPLWKRLPQRPTSDVSEKVSAGLVGDLLVLQGCKGCYYINLGAQHPVWRPFPSWQDDLVYATPTVWQGELCLFGGMIDSGCPTCSEASDKIWTLDFEKQEWVMQERVLPERVIRPTAVFGARTDVWLVGGHHFYNYGDYEAQFAPLHMGGDGKWRQVQNLESFPAKKVVQAAVLQISM